MKKVRFFKDKALYKRYIKKKGNEDAKYRIRNTKQGTKPKR